MHSKSYDVIIVGSGPAGATLGYELSKLGVKVIILEKEKLPRYKPCGGGVNAKVIKLLDFDISPVVEAVIYGASITCKLKNEFTRWYDKPITYTVMRDKFDYFLVEQAKKAEAAIFEEQKVKSVRMTTDQVEVFTSDHVFVGQIVVGADGSNSVVAKGLGLMEQAPLDLGIESEVYVPEDNLAAWNGLVTLDLGSVPGGYGWIFPKKDHLSIGVGGPVTIAKRLKTYHARFFSEHNKDLGECKVMNTRGHLLPLRDAGMPIYRGRGLLIGDAAGLIDAFSGEGIYYAIRSAQLAAPVIEYSLSSTAPNLESYEKAIDRELMPELLTAKALLKLFGLSPCFYVRLLRDRDRVWRAACRILRGEKTYVSIKEELGHLGFLLDLISQI